PGAATVRTPARLPCTPDRTLAVGPATRRSPLLSALRRVHRARDPLLPPGRAHGPPLPVRAGAPDSVPGSRRARIPGAHNRRRAHRLSLDDGDDLARDQVSERLHRYLGVQGEPLPARSGGVPAGPRAEEGALRLEPPGLAGRGVPAGLRRARARCGGGA